jgi:hypothetical protein
LGALALVCGAGGDPVSTLHRPGVEVRTLPANPGRAEVDPVLTDLDGRRAVVVGTDGDLAAVVLRLLRTQRLAEVPVGFVPVDPAGSVVRRLWRLPADPGGPGGAVEVALGGGVEPVPLIRDDAGGVLVGRGVLDRVAGVAYCDDQVALRGSAARLEVGPDLSGGAGLTVTVVRRRLLRERAATLRGRACQVGCDPLVPVRDGIAHPRPVERWTWYRHIEDLLAVRPPSRG